MPGSQDFWEGGLPYPYLDGDGAQDFWDQGLPYPGTGSVASGDKTLSGSSGIASAEEFGSGGEVTLMDKTLTGSAGIESEEAFGSGGSATGPIVGSTGISSGLAFGSGGQVLGSVLLGLNGIPSEETFGSGGLLTFTGPVTGLVGIPSQEAFGTGIVAGPIGGIAVGIESGEAFGSGGSVEQRIIGEFGHGIPSGELVSSQGHLIASISGLLGIRSGELFSRHGSVLTLEALQGIFALYIGGQLRSPYFRVGSLSGERQLNFQGSCQFELLVRDQSGYIPSVGAEVVIWFYDYELEDWQKAFAGSVDSVDSVRYGARKDAIVHSVRCADYGKALSRRLVNMKFPQANFGTLNSIMAWLNSNVFQPEGLEWVESADPGLVIQDLEFNFVPCNEVLDRLAEMTSRNWQVNFDRELRFIDRPATVINAPLDLTEDETGPNSRSWRNMNVRNTRGLYRNVQHIKATYSRKTQQVIETYTHPIYSGPYYPQRIFEGPYLKDDTYDQKVVSVTRVLKNGTEIPFYVQRQAGTATFNPAPADWSIMQIVSDEIEFFWNILAKPDEIPTDGDEITIEFETTLDLPQSIVVRNEAEIAARSVIEGTSGIYEAVEEVQDIEDLDLLQQIGEQLLARFGTMGKEVECETWKFGFEPGQLVNVHLPSKGIGTSLEMTVEGLSFQEEPDKRRILTRVRATNQIQQRDSLAAFQRMVRKLRKPSRQIQNVVTWDLAVTYPGVSNPGLLTGSSLGNPWIVRSSITLNEVAVYFKIPPAGQNIRLNIRADGSTIFRDGFIEYTTAGGLQVFRSFQNPPLTLTKGTRLEIDVLQTGTSTFGQDGTVHLTGWV